MNPLRQRPPVCASCLHCAARLLRLFPAIPAYAALHSHPHRDDDAAFMGGPGTATGPPGAGGGTRRLEILRRLPGSDWVGDALPPTPAPPKDNRMLFVTFGNTAFVDFTHNWWGGSCVLCLLCATRRLCCAHPPRVPRTRTCPATCTPRTARLPCLQGAVGAAAGRGVRCGGAG